MRTDTRYWVLDPAAHRRYSEGGTPELAGTFWEDAAIIDMAQGLAPDEWYCDLCNLPILTRWGGEPFPVPMLGGSALCADHYEEAQGWHHEDEYGEPTDQLLGLWPPAACTGEACCRPWLIAWHRQLGYAYTLLQIDRAKALAARLRGIGGNGAATPF